MDISNSNLLDSDMTNSYSNFSLKDVGSSISNTFKSGVDNIKNIGKSVLEKSKLLENKNIEIAPVENDINKSVTEFDKNKDELNSLKINQSINDLKYQESSNKILGMSKTTFWISLTALVGVASFVTYRILKK